MHAGCERETKELADCLTCLKHELGVHVAAAGVPCAYTRRPSVLVSRDDCVFLRELYWLMDGCVMDRFVSLLLDGWIRSLR